jgi:hypothetical protein
MLRDRLPCHIKLFAELAQRLTVPGVEAVEQVKSAVLEVDGSIEKPAVWPAPGRSVLQLPKGQHLVLIEVE